jgi:[ribosomal protein S18]-alanine N-acetyltransferase
MQAIPSLAIRPMSVDDLPVVLDIDRLSFPQPWPESSYRFELANSQASILLVAEVDEHLVGYIGSWLLVDEIHISTLAVHPDFRQRGIARRLLYEMLRGGISRGAQMATLEVRVSNQMAIDLYKSIGFRVTGLRSGYYRDNLEDAHIMTLSNVVQGVSQMEVEDGG